MTVQLVSNGGCSVLLPRKLCSWVDPGSLSRFVVLEVGSAGRLVDLLLPVLWQLPNLDESSTLPTSA